MSETEVLKHLNNAINELYTVDSNTTMAEGEQISKIIDLLTDYRYKVYGTNVNWDKVKVDN